MSTCSGFAGSALRARSSSARAPAWSDREIRRVAEALPAPIFYVAGPPAMVEAMKAVLEKAGVEDTDVRSEEFFGYESAAAVTS